MQDVMWGGKLSASISLDSLSKKSNMYGLGPLEGLAGEILLIDGKSYVSRVIDSQHMSVVETFQAGAPFFVHAQANRWKEVAIPDTITDIASLEAYLHTTIYQEGSPFLFRLSGKVHKADIHVVNLPPGSTVSRPDEAHIGQISYHLTDLSADVIGFFSTQHQGIFTHHDSYTHMHLISGDKAWMGHVDALHLNPADINLYIPEHYGS